MKILIALMALALAPAFAHADQVFPANQETLESAEASVIAPEAAPENRKANFGKAVEKEAQSLKNASAEERENVGDTVSDQRQNANEHQHDHADAADSGGVPDFANAGRDGSENDTLGEVSHDRGDTSSQSHDGHGD